MVIIPDSAAVADGLTFTIGQITWTTGVFTATTVGEGTDPICIDHVFIGHGSDHTDCSSDHPGNGSDHADNSSTTSPL
jgi:hypothetical protein